MRYLTGGNLEMSGWSREHLQALMIANGVRVGELLKENEALKARVAELEHENAILSDQNMDIQGHLDDYISRDPDM